MKLLLIILALSTIMVIGGIKLKEKTNDFLLSLHFNLTEFESPDTKEVMIRPEVINYLERTRAFISIGSSRDRPIIITSGYRTKEHNMKVNGGTRSYHLKGMAVDCYAKWIPMTTLAKAGLRSGFSTAIVYKTHVHFDIREKGLGLRYAK